MSSGLKEIHTVDQSFQTIIEKGLLYADKTDYIFNLVNSADNQFFLSRPRRFGKTLLLDAMANVFQGRKELFQGLAIEALGYDFPKFPVISLSLYIDADSPSMLKNSLIGQLIAIARKENLSVSETEPPAYFGALIEALSAKRNGAKVVVLIDEYDAPVTSVIDNQKMARANAKILRRFLAVLKAKLNFIRFSFVTGVTRFALTSMDSGPNHLKDISLDPKYAGICGFTVEEFNSLFANRLEPTLARLQELGEMKPTDGLGELRAEISDWYDGYNWGGSTRVLNPYSILYFFDNNSFDSYWIRSGRPSHLTALILSRPMDFLKLRLESYLSDEIRKPELDHLEAGPVLFHSGYLTLDKSAFRPVMDLNSEKTKLVESYSFKLPNFEVSSSYYKDCFSVILGLKLDDLLARREELQEAFLSRDADKVSAFFKKNFARLSYLQKLKSGRNVRLLVQALLMSLSFKVQDEVADQTGRLDLCFEIQERVYVLIELKFIPAQRSLSSEDKTEALAKVALDILSTQARNEILASVVKNKLSVSEYLMALEKKGQADAPAPIKSQCLGQAALEYLTEAEYSAGLAEAVKKELGKAEIKEILKKAGRTLSPPSERIDQELSEAAAKALRDIAEKDYRGVIKNKAEVPPKEIIDLGLSVYGDGKRVVAAFGSK